MEKDGQVSSSQVSSPSQDTDTHTHSHTKHTQFINTWGTILPLNPINLFTFH